MSVRRLLVQSAVLSAATLVLGPAQRPAEAQQETIVPDRPGFTETTQVVGPHVVQFEMGSAIELDGRDADRSRTVAAPLGLVRVGVSHTLELRLSADGDVVHVAGRGPGRTTVSGGSDVEIGAKWAFLDARRADLTMALIPVLSVPVGSASVSSGTFDPTCELSWAKGLNRGFELSGNLNVSRVHDGEGRFTEHAYSLSVSHAIGQRWGGYGEAYGVLASGHRHNAAWTFDTGVTRTLHDSVQVDVEAGRGLSAASADWFLGFGLGFRTHVARHRP